MIITKEIKEKTRVVRFLHKKGLTITHIARVTNLKNSVIIEILKMYFKDFKQPATVFFGSKTESYWHNEDEIGVMPTYELNEVLKEYNII